MAQKRNKRPPRRTGPRSQRKLISAKGKATKQRKRESSVLKFFQNSPFAEAVAEGLLTPDNIGRRGTRKRAAPVSRASPKRSVWQVQDARAHLSSLIDAALDGTPQRITRNGKDTVVVVREIDFGNATGITAKEWLDELQSSPLGELMEEGLIDFDAMRDESPLGPPPDLGNVDVGEET